MLDSIVGHTDHYAMRARQMYALWLSVYWWLANTHGYAKMDVLVALGTSAAYFYSVYGVVRSIATRSTAENEQYFETSVLLIFFILLGKYLESYTKGKTSDAITNLMSLVPEKVNLVSLDMNNNVETEKEIDVQLVQVGDHLKITPGSRVPCDGHVLVGTSHVDESMLTGEAHPVGKKIGDMVIGGTVNTNGVLVVVVTKVGSGMDTLSHSFWLIVPLTFDMVAETMLARIIQLVEDAQTSRAPIQAIADLVSRYFVPTVIIVALVTLITWLSASWSGAVPSDWLSEGEGHGQFVLNFAIAVLVIACPCALGLATPTAVMVATGGMFILSVLGAWLHGISND